MKIAQRLVRILLPLLVAASFLPRFFAEPEPQRDLGGADASKSFVQRSWAGLTEGMRFITKALERTSDKEARPPTKVKLALVGFGRTGTTSLVSGLQLLGYTFLHDDTLPEVHDLYGKYWKKEIMMDDFVRECGNRGFDGLFLFIDDFLDWLAWPENENVQVILSTRDSGRKWAESWLVVAPNIDIFNKRPYVWSQTVRDIYPLFEIIYKDISTQGQPEKYMDVETLAQAYDAHLVKVRNKIPTDRLLEYNVKEGWDPLCQFLNKEVPTTKFPHVNDKVVVQMMVMTFWLFTWIWPFGPLLLAYAIWRMVKFLFFRATSSAAAPTDNKKQD